MRRLFGRALAALVLLMAVGVAFAVYSYFYTWTKYYRINPLTSFEKIRIPKTTGGTIGICFNYTDEETGGMVSAVLPLAVLPYAIPPEPTTLRCPPLHIEFFAPQFPEPPEGYELMEFLADPPALPFGFPYSDDEVALLVEAKKMIKEFGFDNATYVFIVPRPTPVYHETLRLDKKCYVNFAVTRTEINSLKEHFCWLIEIEYIFHPGGDGQLGTEDDYLYAIVILPIVNPWQQPGPGYARILLGGGQYGVIKTTIYWTKPVSQEASGSFTIYIWAQEYQPTPPS